MVAALLASLTVLLAGVVGGSNGSPAAGRGNSTTSPLPAQDSTLPMAEDIWVAEGRTGAQTTSGAARTCITSAILPACGVQPSGARCSPTFQYVANSLAVNSLTLFGMLSAFVILHCFPAWVRVLSPLREAAPRPCSLSSFPFGRFKDKPSTARVSIDGWVVIRFCHVGLKYSILGTFAGCLLLPIYGEGSDMELSDFQRYTITNLDSQTWKVWLVVASSYLLTIAFFLLMVLEWKHYLRMRRNHFMDRAEGRLGVEAAQAQFSLMVERVPPDFQRNGGLEEAFNLVFNSLHSAVLQPYTVHKYDQLLFRRSTGCCSCNSCCCCCRQGNEQGLDRLSRLKESARNSIRKAQMLIAEGRAPGGPTSTGFVTLKKVADQQMALQQVSLFNSRSNRNVLLADYVISPAPEARDIVWRNASRDLAMVRWRRAIGTCICFVGLLVWSVPLVAVRTLTSASSLLWFPSSFVSSLQRMTWVYSLFFDEGYLSAVAVQTLLSLLPYMHNWLAVGWECRKLRSAIARKVLIRNLYFQLASLYYVVIGGILSRDLLSAWTDAPLSCLAKRFGHAIPQVAVYFANFVMARIGLSLPMLLLRPWALLGRLCRRQSEEEPPVHCWIGYEATNLVIVLVVANMYAVIAPLIMVLCVVYFALAGYVYNYLFRYVYTAEFDCQGRFWEELFHGAMSGLLLGALTVTGVVGAKADTEFPFYVMSVLLVIILIFKHNVHSFFHKRSLYMPFEDAIKVDRTVGPDLVRRFDSMYYVDPIERLAGDEAQDASISSENESGEEGSVTSVDCEDLAEGDEGNSIEGMSCADEAQSSRQRL
uniref:CSC1/OSCA1-like 7TM region domain-containing protein n=1 Tax=Alexandrium monilatum TaxID=311494 RepID=A0A7S4Q4I3_9DINO